MTPHTRPLRRAAAIGVLAALACTPVQAFFQLHDAPGVASEVDFRPGQLEPGAAQLAGVERLGADATWNRFGTIKTLVRHGGFLAEGLGGTPVQAARSWIKANRDLFKLSAAGVDALEVVNEGVTPYNEARAVLFRQRFGGLASTHDGLITVGIVNGKVYYVSSSSAGDQPAPEPASLNAATAWLKAAADVNRVVSLSAVSALLPAAKLGDWNLFNVLGFAQEQRARLVAIPIPAGGARAAYETVVLDVQGASVMAYVHFIDARSGEVLRRENRVYHQAGGAVPQSFSGALPEDGSCAQPAEFAVAAGNASITVVASAINVINDITINLYYADPDSGSRVVASADLLTSPELLSYAPSGGVSEGNYLAEVCSYNGAAPLPPTNYFGIFSVSETALPGTASLLPYPPKWRWNPAAPAYDYSDTDTRILGCWDSAGTEGPIEGCAFEFANLAARVPWDVLPEVSLLPTFTTIGNAAITAEAWLSPLTPAEMYRPISLDREYDFPFENIWYKAKCSPSVLVPLGNDIDASTANLFVAHNRMHDWSYFLGFTEQNYNLQLDNFGLTDVLSQNDPEIGNVQAGAITGAPASPTFALLPGRDNANQITLQDGVPGITNQYLFQPLGGSLYVPCTDGSFDMGIVGHEYTHAISNRMVGGPSEGLSGLQGGSMGESWGDLAATEYQAEYGFLPKDGGNPTALARYVTGNAEAGLRNYPLDDNPLNYSNIGYDTPGAEVHSDGEIWNAVQWALRQAFIDEYQSAYPYEDVQRQQECADGLITPAQCPGNRRWIQLIFDAFLLVPAAPSMLDARDAMLAADMARFGGANQELMWKVFAQRGMGELAFSNGGDDPAPIPNFASPLEDEAEVRFRVLAMDGSVSINTAQVYIGHFATRSRPIADTDPETLVDETDALSRRATLNTRDIAEIVPGTYDFIVAAPGYGIHRFVRSLEAGSTTLEFVLPTNWASANNGASVTTTATEEANIEAAATLIDDSEDTGVRIGDIAPVEGAYALIELAGGAHSISRVNVSTAAGPNNGGRFTGIRQFEIWTCNGDCADPQADFTLAYTSPEDAFPGDVPRPVQPQLNLRSFDFPAVTASHLQLRVLSSQCTGNPDFAGEQDEDPFTNTDCPTTTPIFNPLDPLAVITGLGPANFVRATEIQAFGSAPTVNGESAGGAGGGESGGGGGALGALLLLPFAVLRVLLRRRQRR